MNSKLKWITIIAIATVLGVGLVYAATSFTQQISWTPEPSFSVSNPTTLNYGVLALPTTKTEIYTVTNTGTVPVTVTASAISTGASTSWDKTTATIPVSASTTFTLTLAITDIGSCQVTIQ